MRTLWLKIWVAIKVSAAVLLLLYALIFVYNNADKPVTFWIWFGKEPGTTVLLLAFYAFLAGVVGTAFTLTAFRTYRQVQELRLRNRQERNEQLLAEMHAKQASLNVKPMPGEQPPPTA